MVIVYYSYDTYVYCNNIRRRVELRVQSQSWLMVPALVVSFGAGLA